MKITINDIMQFVFPLLFTFAGIFLLGNTNIDLKVYIVGIGFILISILLIGNAVANFKYDRKIKSRFSIPYIGLISIVVSAMITFTCICLLKEYKEELFPLLLGLAIGCIALLVSIKNTFFSGHKWIKKRKRKKISK